MNRELVTRLSYEFEEGHSEGIAKIFRECNTQIPEVVIDPTTDDVKDDRLQFLFRYWHSLPRASDLPSSKNIDPTDMRDALGYIMLLEALDDGWDYRYRVYGSEIAAKYGKDLTGRRTSEIEPQNFIATFFISVYRASTALRRPILTDHVPPLSVSVTTWRRLVLPLVDHSGRVDRFLVGNIPGRWRPKPVEQVWLNRR